MECGFDDRLDQRGAQLPFFEFEEAVNRSDVVVRSQLSICFVESNGAFDVPARIQNTNLTGTKARAGFGIVDGLTFLWEYRLNSWRFKNFPAPTVRFDFNDCH